MPRSRWIVFGLLGAFLCPGRAWPCGLCREDNRAAVYSYEATQKVAADPKALEFVVLKVKGPLPSKTAEDLIRRLSERQGVDASTVKVSTLQKSIGFVFVKVHGIENLVADLSEGFPHLVFSVVYQGS